jgi:hypothetical protein
VRLCFVVPAHGRVDLTRVCLRQLARTCQALAPDIQATAVVIADDENLDTADGLGFATVRRDNKQLGRKFNDGYQLACDPAFNPHPADYVVPCGSDDWVDPVIFHQLPPENTIGVFRQIAVVNEDQTRLSRLRVGWKGGAGVRIIPRSLLELVGYRPAEEDRQRAIDTSSLSGYRDALRGVMPPMVDLDVHPLQIVDWKTRGEQLNTYAMLRGFRRGDESTDPHGELAAVFPVEAIEEMRALAPRVAVTV